MKILVTGAKGFIGKNLVYRLKNAGIETVYEYGRDSGEKALREYCADCDLVFHLAGVNRPKEEKEFMEGNAGVTELLLSCLEEARNPVPVVLTSSVQAELDNPYGDSKREAEKLLLSYGARNGVKVFPYRLPNVFGKWSRPEYNSAVATFCYNIARNKPIRVDDPEKTIRLVYIDDLLEEFTGLIRDPGRAFIKDGKPITEPVSFSGPVYEKKLKEITELIRSFPENRKSLEVPLLSDPFVSKLYSTYLSFLPEEGFSYPLIQKCDSRGSFTEFIRTPERGQVSVNVAHPGITKGQHWHDSKNEKFLVVSGKGLIRFRKVGEEKIIDVHVNGSELTVVDIPTGYVHCIINEGEEDLVTVMWANESFDPAHSDTWREEV